MSKLNRALAIKLFHLYNGEQLPASQLNYPLVAELISEGVIADQRAGRSKSLLSIPMASSLTAFLSNRFGILNLASYIDTLKEENVSRAALVQQAADSKVRDVRTFKGFLVNSYQPIAAHLNDKKILIRPPSGTFQFIHAFEHFVPENDVTIVSIENSENFSQIEKLAYLFTGLKPLFVSRYPQNQSKDLIRWLNTISNPFLHFGDYDFAGINIYLQEYKRHLGDRAEIFIPSNFEVLLRLYGNKKLYDSQKLHSPLAAIEEPRVLQIIALINQYKKGLEQEALIRQ